MRSPAVPISANIYVDYKKDKTLDIHVEENSPRYPSYKCCNKQCDDYEKSRAEWWLKSRNSQRSLQICSFMKCFNHKISLLDHLYRDIFIQIPKFNQIVSMKYTSTVFHRICSLLIAMILKKFSVWKVKAWSFFWYLKN